MPKVNRKPARLTRRSKRGEKFERLESRQLMAAHIVGDPTVYATIQAAVDAAKPNATINVDAGAYNEQVYVSKTLTIRGAQAGKDARSNARNGATETIMNGALLSDGTRNASFYIAANDVTIDGFTVQNETMIGDTGAGLVIAPSFSGTRILNNIVQNNVAGLFLANNSVTDPAVIRFNIFRNNNNPGSNGGRAIYTNGGISGGNLTNVLIDSNAILSNYGSTGTTSVEGSIALESRTLNTQHYVTITNNCFDNDGKAVLVYNADHIDIENNFVTNGRDQWSGQFRFEGGASNVTIQGNTLYANTGPAVRIDEKGFAGPNFNFTVTNNNFYGNSTAYTNHQSVVLSALNQYDGTFIVTNNWWGDATGPSGDGPGKGDALVLSGNPAVYAPWATAPIGSSRMPYYGVAQTTDALIQLEDFDQGGEGVAYHDNGVGNNVGAYRKYNTSVDIGATSDVGGGYMITSTAAGEWLKYQINATQAGTYTIDFRVLSAVAGGTFHLNIDGVNATGTMTVPATGNSTWGTISKTGVVLSAGLHDLQLVFDTANTSGSIANMNWMRFTNTTAPSVPTAPSNVVASAVNFATVNVNWQDNSSTETGFIVERRSLPYGTWTQVGTVASNVTSFIDTSASASTLYSYRIRAINAVGQSANSNEAAANTPARTDQSYLSDLPFAGPTINGWGPIERDQSVGGPNANDGLVMTLNGVTYSKGLGTNAISDASFTLGGAYGTFITDIGIDDHELYDGSVIFQVFADGTKIYDSGMMTPDSATQHLNLSVVGVQTLRLHVDDAGDGPDFDQADWAGARLLLAPPVIVPTVPGTPSGVSAVAVSQTQVNLSWADASGETSYTIQRSLDDIDFVDIATMPANTTSYNDPNLLAGTHYWYRIVASNDVGDSAYSNVTDATTVAVPQLPIAPSALAASAVSVSEIDLTWSDNSNDELNFIVERSTDGVTFTQIGTPAPNTSSYIDTTNLLAGTTYYYRVDAVNDIGTSLSTVANATTFAAPTAPLAPGNLVATPVSQTQINLTWSDNSINETNFILDRSTDGITFSQLALLPANTTSYSDSTGLVAGMKFYYRIRATNSIGESANTDITSATTFAAPQPPAAPSALTASAGSATSITLTWTDNSLDETNFILERSTDGVTFTTIATPLTNATTYTDTGLVAATTYSYRISAVNAAGASGVSNIATATTLAAPTVPLAPSNLVATALSPTQVSLSWTDNATDEIGFVLERSTDGTTWIQIATPAANSTGTTDGTSVVGGTSYSYRLRAINAVGASDNSNVATVTTPIPPPNAPSSLVATATSASSVTVTWIDNSADETGFILERSLDGTNFVQIATPAANATSYIDNGLSASTKYYYRVRAVSNAGMSPTSSLASATTQLSTALPTGWIDGDIGTTGKAGNATYTAGTYTVTGAGTGIGKTTDALNFAATTLAGNGTFTVRVAANSGTAGIMLRDGNASNAKFVALTVDSSGHVIFSRRNTVGANVQTNTGGTITGAVYLRLVRSGNNIVGYTSTNGTTWKQVQKISLTMSLTLNVGMTVSSSSTTTLATSKFDNVSLLLG